MSGSLLQPRVAIMTHSCRLHLWYVALYIGRPSNSVCILQILSFKSNEWYVAVVETACFSSLQVCKNKNNWVDTNGPTLHGRDDPDYKQETNMLNLSVCFVSQRSCSHISIICNTVLFFSSMFSPITYIASQLSEEGWISHWVVSPESSSSFFFSLVFFQNSDWMGNSSPLRVCGVRWDILCNIGLHK